MNIFPRRPTAMVFSWAGNHGLFLAEALGTG